jgi:hypothetical protein
MGIKCPCRHHIFSPMHMPEAQPHIYKASKAFNLIIKGTFGIIHRIGTIVMQYIPISNLTQSSPYLRIGLFHDFHWNNPFAIENFHKKYLVIAGRSNNRYRFGGRTM